MKKQNKIFTQKQTKYEKEKLNFSIDAFAKTLYN